MIINLLNYFLSNNFFSQKFLKFKENCILTCGLFYFKKVSLFQKISVCINKSMLRNLNYIYCTHFVYTVKSFFFFLIIF